MSEAIDLSRRPGRFYTSAAFGTTGKRLFSFVAKTTGLFVFLVWCSPLLKAQYSITDTFSIYLKRKPVLYYSLDGRNSFIRDKPATIDGIRMGLSFGGKIRLLFGLYDLRRPVYREYLYNPGSLNQEMRSQRSDLYYVSFTCDYVLLRSRWWKLTLPVQLGLGQGNRREFSPLKEVRVHERFVFMPLEFSFNASFNLTSWLSAGAGIGYRYALFSNTASTDFSGTIYTYGIGIDPLEIYEKFLRKK